MKTYELKRIIEKKLGKSWDQIIEQADLDTAKLQKLKDPIAEAYKKSSISHQQMFKNSMKNLGV